MRRTTLLLAALFAAFTATAHAAEPADLALVLLTDVSKSMDSDEYAMVKAGYREAFADPEVIAAVLGAGGVAVAYVEFSSKREIVLVRGWTVLTDAETIQGFGEAVALAPRSSAGNTALAASLRQAAVMLMDNEFGATRLVIDVASDHPTDFGRSAAIRDAIVATGITINGLPIVNEHPIGTIDGRLSYSSYQTAGGITEFFRRDIIGGPGSFLVEVRDHGAFGEALKRKLLKELLVAQAQ